MDISKQTDEGDRALGQLPNGRQTLIVYGDLPKFRDETDHVVFDGRLTNRNRRSFEFLLRRELATLAGHSLEGALIAPLHSASELPHLLKQRRFTSVIFYGHTLDITGSGPIAGHQELALTGSADFLSAADWAAAMVSAGIHETLIAGCSSASFAAGVTSVAPIIRAGGLYLTRVDEAKGNSTTVIDFRIRKQPIKWWGPKQ